MKLNKNHFLFFLALSFVFISTSALSIQKTPLKLNLQAAEQKPINKFYTPIPRLKKETSSFPVLSGLAVLAVDLESGVPLYEKNPDSKLLPASTTKILTALVAVENYNLEDEVKIGSFFVEGQKMGLFAGEELKVEDLLYGMLVYSANDAAEALARNFPGGREEFMKAMNSKASELSLKDSFFVNPTGLDGNVTTARDLARLSEVAMRSPVLSKIVGTKETTLKDKTGKISYKFKNINELLGEVDGVLGVKTGWTENARENLVTYIERDGKKIMIVILGSQDRFGETKELINWIFENYSWNEVILPNIQQ